MTKEVGRNLNTNTEAAVNIIPLNDLTATKIGDAVGHDGRLFFRVDLTAGAIDKNIYIRLYPAAQDNLARGILLTRRTLGNDNLYHSHWEMPDGTKYYGEISAIVAAGNGAVDISVTEF